MSWYCVIIVDAGPGARHAVAFVSRLRRAWQDAGAPEDASVFINRGSASRTTFLLSPAAASLAGDLLARHDALPCAQQPSVTRYTSVRL